MDCWIDFVFKILVIMRFIFILSILSAGLGLSYSTYYCEDPGIPSNGYRVGNEFSVGYSVSFNCSEDYMLVGSETITCIQTYYGAEWTDITPVCAVKHETTRTRTSRCTRAPRAGRHAVKLSISTKTVLVFGCKDDKYTYDKGDTVVQCIDKKWIGKPLECRHKAKCPEQAVSFSTHKTVTGFYEGDTATFSCPAGHVLSSDIDTVTCNSSGQWSSPWPSCQAVDCGTPPPLSNAILNYQSTLFESVVTYTCEVGYIAIGINNITCMENAKWSYLTVRCEIVLCPIPLQPTNGRAYYISTKYNSVANYKCNTGYILNGTYQRTCTQNGSWQPNPPVCQSVQCGSLSNPTNGRVEYVTTSYRSTSNYYCNYGYVLVGVKSRQCLSNGTWSMEPPVCSPVDCGSNLPNPANGDVHVVTTTLGSLAKYNCTDQFILVGHDTRICQADGTWSGQIPSCVTATEIDCGGLSPPMNGFIQYNTTHYDSVATYTCRDGFKLVGVSSRMCQKNSQWSNSSPTCQEIKCGILTSPANGYVSVSSRAFNSMAMYSCQEGYALQGNKTRRCMYDKTWSGAKPSCQIIDCLSLPIPVNGSVVFNNTTYNSIATYSCNAGLTLIGPTKRKCQSNKQWSGDQPSCLLDCGLIQLTNPNTRVSYLTNSTVVGSIAQYKCIPGYFISENGNQSICQENGSWTNIDTECEPVDCGPLDPPVNGEIFVFNTTLASPARYSCRVGFEIDGNEFRVCTINGSWSGSPPTCKIIDCGTLPAPDNGNVSLTGTTFISIANYTCNLGYNLSLPTIRFCTIDGQWSGSEPTCDPVDCGPLDSPVNGEIFVFNTTLSSSARYSCNTGFEIDGNETRICTINGSWSGLPPTCKIIDCKAPPTPLNGQVEFSETLFTSRANYSCNNGYILNGSPVRLCTDTGLWSGPDPICKAIDCGVPNAITNGRVFFNGTVFNSRAVYSCNYGYRIQGVEFQYCQANGLWNGSTPTCTLIDCGDPGTPQNGFRSFVSTFINAVVTYTCPSNLQLYGARSRRCQHNGRWSEQLPTCGPISCGDPGRVDNGLRFFFGTTVGEVVTFSCNTGFELQGNPSRQCNSDGNWSGTVPTCLDVRPRCPNPGTPSNGASTVSGFTPGSVARYSCVKGYMLIGNGVRQCDNEGKWTNNVPTCQRILSCSDPGTPQNGHRINNNLTVGSIVYYICNDGFDLTGSSGRQCKYTGKWSGTAVNCTKRNLTCESNGTVFDSVGRQCTCVNGQMVNCCRYRQDWLNLSNEKRTRYIQAVLTVSSDPIYRPLYQTLMQQYYNGSQTPAQSLDSSNTQFLPWHRYFLHQYEDMLRMVDPTVYIPYWDWTLLPRTPYQSLVFSPSRGFGNSSDPSSRCVNNGPFRNGQFLLSLKGSCLKRRYGDTASLLTRSQLENIILSQPAGSFRQFFSLLTLPYITVRCTIGGTICNVQSSPPAEDPLHLLILSFVDSIWSRWQSYSIEHKLAGYGNDNTLLVMADGTATVSDYHDSSSLPNSVSVCYDNPANSTRATRSVIDQDMLVCPLQNWMDKLGLNSSQRNVVKAACRLFFAKQ